MAGKKYTDQQKEEFFRLLDRGGTVRAAARAVGVHEDAGYNWLRKTGLTMARAAPRTYPAELKAVFLRLVREREIISTVAHELGIHRPTAYAWARKAGISTSEARKVNPRREEFLRLRAAGLTRVEARARVGADARSATDWDKGITIINRGRVYPAGRVVRYPVKNNDVVPERRTRAIGGSVFPQCGREDHPSPLPQPARTGAVAGSTACGVVDPGDRVGDGTRTVDDQPRSQAQHRLGEGDICLIRRIGCR
jgi:transposase-like protein